MQGIVRWCLKNRSVVFLAAIVLIAAGTYAPQLGAVARHRVPAHHRLYARAGAGPNVVDEQVTQPLQSDEDLRLEVRTDVDHAPGYRGRRFGLG